MRWIGVHPARLEDGRRSRCPEAGTGGYGRLQCQHGRVTEVRSVHTADLTATDRRAVRRLLDGAFDGNFGADDWEHTLGGLHTVVLDGGEPVAHVTVVQRRLLHRGRSIRTGYVEGLAVRPDRRRRGLATVVMAAAERQIVTAYDLGALSDGTGIDDFYQRRGWLTWRGPTSVLGPTGLRRTAEDDGGVLVLPTPTGPELDPDQPLACDWRPGDVW